MSIRYKEETVHIRYSFRETYEEVQNQLGTLQTADNNEFENAGYFYDVDPESVEVFANMARGMEEKESVYDMTGMWLKELSQWVDTVRHTITTANQLHVEGKRVEIAQMGEKNHLAKDCAGWRVVVDSMFHRSK